MIIATTPTIDGKRIARYLGVVTCENTLGAGIEGDILASLTDIALGRPAANHHEEEPCKAKDNAVREMARQAQGECAPTPPLASTWTAGRSRAAAVAAC